MTQPNFHDVELISAYLDGQLSPAESTRLETRLKTDEEYRRLLNELSQSRAILRKLPARRAPRNFTLTPKMAGLKPPVPRAFSIFRLASAVMALLFIFTYAANISQPAYYAFRAAVPAPALGIGGSGYGGGGDSSSNTESPAAAAPMAPVESVTATPEVGLFLQAAPTQAASEAAIPTEVAVEPDAQQLKLMPNAAPEQTQVPQEQRIPIQLPIPAGLQFGLLGLAIISAASAYFVRARSDTGWLKARTMQTTRPSIRQLIIIILVVLTILALIISIQWVSSTTFYANVPPVVALGDKVIPADNTVSLGDKAILPTEPGAVSGPPVIGGDKGSGPAGSSTDGATASPGGVQQLRLEAGLGYTMYHTEQSGLMTSIDFPADIFPANTNVTYTPGLSMDFPVTSGTIFADRAFLLSVPPESGEPGGPITISLDYGTQLASVVDEAKLKLYWWTGSEWVDAASTCSPESAYEHLTEFKRLRLTVCKLGSFVLVAP